MKNIILILLAVLGLGASAQAQPKIATLDMRKVFDGYYKTKQADANLKDLATDMEKRRKDMIDDFKKQEDDYKKLLDKANDQAVSADERGKSKEGAEKKLLDLRGMEQGIGQFQQSARATLDEKKRQMRDKIVAEIREVITAKSKAGAFTLVVDTSADSVNLTPVVLYTNGENDLTDSVLTQLNATAPRDTPVEPKKDK